MKKLKITIGLYQPVQLNCRVQAVAQDCLHDDALGEQGHHQPHLQNHCPAALVPVENKRTEKIG